MFEDLHWVDAETQGFLDSVIESLPATRIFLAVNYRPEYRHGWSSKTYYRQLRIDPLAAASAAELLDSLLGGDASVEPLRPLLIARTEGNPFFLEESVRTLVETGGLAGEPGRYRLARPADTIQMPATVQVILAARIDRLRPELKRLLQAASVIGKDVPLRLMEAIAGMPEAALRAALAELQTAEFIYETRLFPDLEYTFKHALTHEITYGTVLQERRRALHAAIVAAIERHHAERLAEHVEVLAHHATRGGIPDKAVRYLRQAGEKSVARSANREAVVFFDAALETVAELPETGETLSEALDIHIALGPALISLTGAAAPRVSEVYRRALALVERLGETSRRFPVLWGLWFISYTIGRYDDALESGQRLLEDAQAGDDSGRLLEAHHAMWPTCLAMGAAAAAAPHMERGIAIYKREEHAAQMFLYAGHDPGACCRYQFSQVRWLLGYPDQAQALIRDAERLADELNHPQTTTVVLWMKAWLEYQRGEREAAARTAERLRELATAHGFVHWLDAALVSAHLTAKPVSAAALDALYAELAPLRIAMWRKVFSLSVFAQLCVEAGEAERGLRALAGIGETDRRAYLAPEVHRLEGELRLCEAAPAIEEAERSFRTAIDIARSRSERSLELRATTSLARLLAARGRRDEAHRLLADVYAWFTEGFDTVDLRSARALLHQLSGA
jgi:tetratricopeptide (TPR) repeat protein